MKVDNPEKKTPRSLLAHIILRPLITGSGLGDKVIKTICIIAGEASGDLHGASLIKALRQGPEAFTFFGLGGPDLERSGLEMVYPPPLNIVGFTEVLKKIFHIWKAYQKVKEALKQRKPDLIILIDYPDLNLRLARIAHQLHIPVLYYISPQVWAWRPGRIRTIARYVDRLAVILPFEKEFYSPWGVNVDFVGHPLLDGLGPSLLRQGSLPAPAQDRPLIGLLPGSRPTEVKAILPVLLESAVRLTREMNQAIEFILPVAATLEEGLIRKMIAPYLEKGLPIQLVMEDSRQALAACHHAIVASGTVTLEAAILGVPILIVYKVSPLNYWIARHLIRVPYIGLVNWVAGRKIIPELIQEQAQPEAIAEASKRFLRDPGYYRQVREELLRVRDSLGGPGASARVAKIALEMTT